MTNFVESEEEAKSTGIEPVCRKFGCIGERARGRSVSGEIHPRRFAASNRLWANIVLWGKQRVSRKCGNLKKLLDCGASVVEKGTLFLFTINKAL